MTNSYEPNNADYLHDNEMRDKYNSNELTKFFMMDYKMKNLKKASQLATPNLFMSLSGDTGVGKTTFCLEFPKPVIIAVENGLKSIEHKDPDVFHIQSVDDVLDALYDLYNTKHAFKTVAIDSMTALEEMITSELLRKENSKSLAHLGGGYGAGYMQLAAKMGEVIANCKLLLPRMHVIMVLHSEIETYNPEDSEPYDRLTVRIDKRCKKMVVDGPDIVAFLRQRKDVQKTTGSHIAVGTGKRELLCHTCPSATSKNRIGITDVLELEPGTNPILNANQRNVKTAETGSEF